MKSVLVKTLVVQYYKLNTGFFLVLFVLLFGLLNGKATVDLHHFLMSSMCNEPAFFAGAMMVWLLYFVKCLSFCMRVLRSPEGAFLAAMQAMDDRKQIVAQTSVFVMLMAPVLVYGAVATTVGIWEGHWVLPVGIQVVQLVLCSAGAMLCFRTINETWKAPLLQLPAILPKVRKPFASLLLHYSVQEKKATFIGVKALSLLLLQGMVLANRYEVNRESVCVIMMFLISAHALLPVHYTRFSERKLGFLRNMPLARVRMISAHAVTYLIVFLPELLFLLLNGKHSLDRNETLSLYCLAVTQLLLFTSLQYLPRMTTERYTMIVFVFFFGSLLFLASFNLWPLAIANIVAGVTLFSVYYYRYEHETL